MQITEISTEMVYHVLSSQICSSIRNSVGALFWLTEEERWPPEIFRLHFHLHLEDFEHFRHIKTCWLWRYKSEKVLVIYWVVCLGADFCVSIENLHVKVCVRESTCSAELLVLLRYVMPMCISFTMIYLFLNILCNKKDMNQLVAKDLGVRKSKCTGTFQTFCFSNGTKVLQHDYWMEFFFFLKLGKLEAAIPRTNELNWCGLRKIKKMLRTNSEYTNNRSKWLGCPY